MGPASLESISGLLSVLPTLAMGSAALLVIAWLLATPLAGVLIRRRVRRLPAPLAERFAEEWAAEAHVIDNRLRKVAFALALFLTPTRSFVEAVGGPTAVAGNLVVLFDVHVYSTSGLRLIALIVDFVVMACLGIGLAWLGAPVLSEQYSVGTVLITFALWTLILLMLQVFLVVRFGGSPGKLLMSLRIIPMGGGPLTFKHAALRMAPDYLFRLWRLAGTLVVVSTLDFEGLTQAEQSALFAQQIAAPWWMSLLSPLAAMWGVAELCSYFASSQRRAMHDRLAGTVVVIKGPDVVTAGDIVPRPSRGLLR